jgi:hypothetical protein
MVLLSPAETDTWDCGDLNNPSGDCGSDFFLLSFAPEVVNKDNDVDGDVQFCMRKYPTGIFPWFDFALPSRILRHPLRLWIIIIGKRAPGIFLTFGPRVSIMGSHVLF